MKRFVFAFSAVLCLLVQPLLQAEAPAPLYPGFPAIRESKAYKKFSMRTYSEFSKILYLIDRYSDSAISINYEEQNYTAAFSTTVARWFLSRNYKKQTAREWIAQWCNKSIFTNKPIFVKLPNEKFVLAREVLGRELDDLERVVRENQVQLVLLAPTVILAAPSLKTAEISPMPAENPEKNTPDPAPAIIKSSPAVTALPVNSEDAQTS